MAILPASFLAVVTGKIDVMEEGRGGGVQVLEVLAPGVATDVMA